MRPTLRLLAALSTLLFAGVAHAVEPATERQVFRTIIGRYADPGSLCVVRTAAQYPPVSALRPEVRANLAAVPENSWAFEPFASSNKAVRASVAGDFRAIFSETTAPALETHIDQSDLRVKMELVDTEDTCATALILDSPFRSGDTIFVNATLKCGGCGRAGVYALRRREEVWEIVAFLLDWVS